MQSGLVDTGSTGPEQHPSLRPQHGAARQLGQVSPGVAPGPLSTAIGVLPPHVSPHDFRCGECKVVAAGWGAFLREAVLKDSWAEVSGGGTVPHIPSGPSWHCPGTRGAQGHPAEQCPGGPISDPDPHFSSPPRTEQEMACQPLWARKVIPVLDCELSAAGCTVRFSRKSACP